MGSEGMHPGFQDSLRLLPGWIEAVRQVMT
jgi:hypothetical protein